MAESVSSVEFGFGTVQYVKEIEAVPASSKKTGNVTINNMATPGSPEHFLVTFMLSYGPDDGALGRRNIFHWTEAVVGLPRTTPYSEVEAQAARQLAPSLRAAADAIEKQVEEFDGKAADSGS